MNQKQKLPGQFLAQMKDLESSYLAQIDPTRQSGFLGGEVRWRRERELILEAVDRDGDFLDIGCANGYLVECLYAWAKERGIALVPYGVDLGSGLIEVAKKRLPQYASHFWVGNAWEWIPPRKFRYVYTLTDLVPDSFLKDYLTHVMENYVEKEGFLIIGAYGSTSQSLPAQDVTNLLKKIGFLVAGNATCGELPVSHVAWAKAEIDPSNMRYIHEIILKPFEKKDQNDTKSLILAGLKEHWGILDPNKNKDLDNIDVSYANSYFLLAWHENKIVGTGTLVPRSKKIAEIVRMSVEKAMRRRGIGKTILKKLINEARIKGFKQVILETTQTWHEVIAFYKDFGFQISHYQEDNVYLFLNL